MNWPFYNYVMSLFTPGNIAPSKSALSVVMQLLYFVMINVYMELSGFSSCENLIKLEMLCEKLTLLMVESGGNFSLRCFSATKFHISSVQFSHSVVSDSLRPHESQHTRPPCPSPTPGVHSDSHPSSK